jgi:hypothetical protein
MDDVLVEMLVGLGYWWVTVPFSYCSAICGTGTGNAFLSRAHDFIPCFSRVRVDL